MLFGFFLSWEFAIVAICVLLLAMGLVRITMRRQIEVLKDYLQPEQLPIEQLVMNADKSARKNGTEQEPSQEETDSESEVTDEKNAAGASSHF